MTYTDYKGLSKRLIMSEQTVRRLYQEGKIPGIKLGRKIVRFDIDAVDQALARLAATSHGVRQPTIEA